MASTLLIRGELIHESLQIMRFIGDQHVNMLLFALKILLLSENLEHLSRGVVLAHRTLRIIRQNLAWSFVYNLVALPLAMAGFVTPWMAGIGMSGSSLLVVLNSLRLQKCEAS